MKPNFFTSLHFLHVGISAQLRISPSIPPWEYTTLTEPRSFRVLLELRRSPQGRFSSGEAPKNVLFGVHLAIWSPACVSLIMWAIPRARQCRVVWSSARLWVDHFPTCIVLGAWSSRFGIFSFESSPHRVQHHFVHANSLSMCAQRRCLCLFASASSCLCISKEQGMFFFRDMSCSMSLFLEVGTSTFSCSQQVFHHGEG